MCLIVILHRVVDGAPLLIGANREEYFARGGEPPSLHRDPVPWVGGLDPVGGGTWLGVNRQGLLVAVTNRPRSRVPDARRSRGLLVRDLLQLPDASSAQAEAVRRLQTEAYDGCNLVILDGHQASVLHFGDWLRVLPLPPGVHVLANGDLNDEQDERVQHVQHWLHRRGCTSRADGVMALREVCAHAAPQFPPVCYRRDHRGTTSSSVLALPVRAENLDRATYFHSQGPPDVTPYQDHSYLFRELAEMPSTD